MRAIHLLFLFLILFSYSYAIEEEDELEELDDESFIQDEIPQSGIPSASSEEQQEHQRQIIISCILLTKQFVSAQQSQFKETLDTHGKEQSNQMTAYQKILARLLDICYVNLHIEEAVKLLSDMKNNEFKIDNYIHVQAKFKWEDYAKTSEKEIDLKLNSQEENLLKFMEEFEKAMKDRQEKQETEEEFKKINRDDYEPKIAGLSMKNTPKSFQLIYLIGIIGISGFLIVYGLISVNKPKKFPGDKKEKKRKAKEQ